MHLDEPGAQVEILERDDGVLELRAALPVPANQAWFWTEQWQRREREVDEHVARDEVTVEMTWSFAGPDGRATFELITIDGDLRCRWRRVGDHADFKRP
jgi:hypothetical protein